MSATVPESNNSDTVDFDLDLRHRELAGHGGSCRLLRAEELGETLASPTQDIEFMLSHSDNVEASGFVQHLKLPHYVDFQSELELVRRLRAQHAMQSEDQPNAQQEQADGHAGAPFPDSERRAGAGWCGGDAPLRYKVRATAHHMVRAPSCRMVRVRAHRMVRIPSV